MDRSFFVSMREMRKTHEKIIAINAGPRKGWNTDQLVREVPCCNSHKIPVLLIMTSNCSESAYDAVGYTAMLEKYRSTLTNFVGDTKAQDDGRIKEDYAAFDMHIDNAMAMNETITTFGSVYYFAYPCSVTAPDENGQLTPNPDITEGMFMKSAILMSRYTGSTKGGIVIDESWRSNDGLVNEVSAKTPSGAPGKAYTPGEAPESGIWYEMPTTVGDHMYFQGGMTKRVKIQPFYLDMVQMISALENA